MPLIRPRAGKTEVIAALFGRQLVKDEWFYPAEGGVEKKEIFSRWATTKRPPAIIFPFTVDREVVAIRQFRNGADDFVLELPGGPADALDSYIKTGGKELAEETGYKASEIIVLPTAVWIDPASIRTPFVPVLALGCVKVGEPKPEKTEILEVKVFPVDEWYEMMRIGEVCDAKTIATSHLVLPYIGGRVTF